MNNNNYKELVEGNEKLNNIANILDRAVEGMDEDTFQDYVKTLNKLWACCIALSVENSTLKDRIVELGGR